MPISTKPGVYVQELPGPQQIVGVATSTTAFVGPASAGPFSTPALVDSWSAFTQLFGGFAFTTNLPFAVYNFFAQGGTQAYVVRTPENPGLQPASAIVGDLALTAAAAGSWGNGLAVLLVNDPLEPVPSPTPTPDFALRILFKAPTAAPSVVEQLVERYATTNNLPQVASGADTYWVVEEFAGLTADDTSRPAPGQPAPIETKLNSQSLFVRGRVTGAGGTRPGNVIVPAQLQGGAGDASTTPVDYASALASLDPISDASLLVLPDTGMIADLGQQRSSLQQALSYCEARTPRDLFLVCDAPFGLSVQDLVAFKTGVTPAGNALDSSYGAIYHPWVDCQVGLGSRSVPLPPSGALAGTYAATDQRVGVWKAPAGIADGVLQVAVGLSAQLTDGDQDVLNQNGIDAIRAFPRYGIVAYGARTLSTDPSLVYVNVRRLLTYVELSLYFGLQWTVFEANDQQLWGAVNRDVTQFLTQLWQAGALFGASAAEAFQVQVDAGNNPPSTRGQGILYVDVSLAPVRPAEFVIIRIQQATLPQD